MTAFDCLVTVLGPAEGGVIAVRAGDTTWTSLPVSRASAAVVWGREPAARGMPPWQLLAFAASREFSGRRTRRALARSGDVRAVRLRPSMLREDLASRVRAALAAGLVLQAAPTGVATVLDEAARVAGAVPTGPVWPGAGDAVIVPCRGAAGDCLLRLYPVAGSAGSAAAESTAVALTRAAAAGSALVPRLLARGEVSAGSAGGIAVPWTLEQRLPGRRPRRLGDALLAQAVDFSARLPVAPGPARVPRPGIVERWADEWDVIEATVARAWPHETVLVHGDFWASNLLAAADGSTLTGVVDWDACHQGVPGVDVLHLIATDERRRAHRSLGGEFATAPWRGERYRRATATYWSRFAEAPAPTLEQLDAVGLAWWAGQVAATLTRDPGLADDLRWVGANIAPVVTTVRSYA